MKTDFVSPNQKVATMTQQLNRTTLQGLRAIKIAKDHEQIISHFMNEIKTRVIYTAENTDDTVYNYDYIGASQREQFGRIYTNDVIIDNLEEVLLRLRQVFDGCVVKYSICERAQDGNYYERSTIPESLLMRHRGNFETRKRFTIDWS
jgi:hypothetical protein